MRSANPNHGQTICLKGLILYESGKKEEGRQCVNQGIKLAATSFFAWDVMARIKDMDGAPQEAIACMKNALRQEPENENAAEVSFFSPRCVAEDAQDAREAVAGAV